MASDTVSDIERTLNVTYYVAKKNKMETSIIFNKDIFETINQCIISEIDDSDTYILINSHELPLNYTLTSTIEVINDIGK